MTKLLHKELTHDIIGAYFDVYNNTSRTYPECIYEGAMVEELRRRGHSSSRQDEYRIFYKGYLVGLQRLDLFPVKEVVAEIKVAERLTALHKAQGISYLKTVGKQVGLLFNFGSTEPEFERLYFEPKSVGEPLSSIVQQQIAHQVDESWLHPDLAYAIVGGLCEVHRILGPGFVVRIYASACYYEFGLRGLEVKRQRRMRVAYKGVVAGDIAFAHLLVEGRVMVFPVAITDVKAINLENLKTWMRMQGIKLGILANFRAVSLEPVFIRV